MIGSTLLFLSFGPTEIFLISIVVILLFGSSQIPKITKSIIESVKEFKKAKKDSDNEKKD